MPARPWFLAKYQPEKKRVMWARRSICASPYLLDKHGEKIRSPMGNAMLRARENEQKPGWEKNKEPTGRAAKATFNVPISAELETEMDQLWSKRDELLATRDETIYAEDRTLDIELWNLVRTTLFHLASKKSERPAGGNCLREWPRKVKERWALIMANEKTGRRWSAGWEGAAEVTGADGCKLSILQHTDHRKESDESEELSDEYKDEDEDEENTQPDDSREDGRDPMEADSDHDKESPSVIPNAWPTNEDRAMLIAWVEGRLKGPELKKFDATLTELWRKSTKKRDVNGFFRRIMGLLQISLNFWRPVEEVSLGPEMDQNVANGINAAVAVMEALGGMFEVDGLGFIGVPTDAILFPPPNRRQRFKSQRLAVDVSSGKPTPSQQSAVSQHNMKLRGGLHPVSTLTSSQSKSGPVKTIKRKRSQEEDGGGPAKRQAMGSNLSTSEDSDESQVISNLKLWKDRLSKLVNEEASIKEGMSWLMSFLNDVEICDVHAPLNVTDDEFYELLNDALFLKILPDGCEEDLSAAAQKFFPKKHI